MAEAQLVTVELAAGSYPIHIAPGAIADAGRLVRPHLASDRGLIVADERVAALHGAALVASLKSAGMQVELVTFPAGEASKSLATADQLWTACAERRIDRNDAVIALGGGVTGDLAGFVAACWMRGVRLVQVPTSLLAMVDSSVGGKTGVNSAAGKNLIGAFKQPVCVVIDPALVATMERREYRAGLAEVLKYGVIHDAGFFAWQEANGEALAAGDPLRVAEAVATSCRIKAEYVRADEREQGVRAHLNYGHTFGHALERETAYRSYLHGEAVAIGMRMAVDLAARLGVAAGADASDLARRQDALLGRFGLPLVHRCKDVAAEALRLTGHCRLDKKVASGRVRFVLPRRLGEVVIHEVRDEAAIAAAFTSALATG